MAYERYDTKNETKIIFIDEKLCETNNSNNSRKIMRKCKNLFYFLLTCTNCSSKNTKYYYALLLCCTRKKKELKIIKKSQYNTISMVKLCFIFRLMVTGSFEIDVFDTIVRSLVLNNIFILHSFE